ncbi:MAG: hypothetical protein CR982_10435 [Candidatus Cloacimonadota bacterium]|nr:MAG: hypothetical protein CR982_10435 [Candidatus Cloacimonadota bacterium]PIE79706.1 MAG: hypothetical protein CSA15_02715 [Candidatus Delongbacteria bacterium]
MGKWEHSLKFLLSLIGFYLGNLFFEFGCSPDLYFIVLSSILIFLLPMRRFTTFLIAGFLIFNINIIKPYNDLKRLKESQFNYLSSKGVVVDKRVFSNSFLYRFKLEDSKVKGSFFTLFDKYQLGDSIEVSSSFEFISQEADSGKRSYFTKNLLDNNLIKVDSKGVKIYKRENGFYFKRSIEDVRGSIKNRINSLYGYSSGNFFSGVLIGDKSSFEEEDIESYRKSGSIHLLAVSGLHVGIVVLLLSLFPRRYRYSHIVNPILKSIFLILYIFLTGGSPSVVRAVMMVLIFYLSYPLKRVFQLTDLVAITGFFSLIFFPETIVTDGFLLSYSAVYAILLFSDKVKLEGSIFNKYYLAPLKISFFISLILSPILLSKYGFYNFGSIIFAPLLIGLTMSGIFFGSISLLGIPELSDFSRFYGDLSSKGIDLINNFLVEFDLLQLNFYLKPIEVILILSAIVSFRFQRKVLVAIILSSLLIYNFMLLYGLL